MNSFQHIPANITAFTQPVHWTIQLEFCWLIKPRFILTYGSSSQAEGDHLWTLYNNLKTGRRWSLGTVSHSSTKKGCSWWSCHYAWMCCQPCSGGKWTHNYNCWPNYSLIGDNRNKVSDFFSFTPLPAKRQSLERSALSVLIVPLPKGMHEPGIFQSGELFSLLHLREKNICEMLPENLVETIHF